jgi:NAD(P)-dependent dehydrogenase (short-subunit alcohol dehydrogenase family)
MAAVVTGAANGIGKAVCRILAGLPTTTTPANYGGRSSGIVCVDYDEKRLLETTQELEHELKSQAASKVDTHLPKIIALPGDVSDEALVQKAVKTCVKEFGRIDKMIANAGICGPIVDIFHETPEDFERIFKINVFGVFHCIKYAALAMKAQEIRPGALDRGSIVAVASVAGMAANAGPVAYSASKAAVMSLVSVCVYMCLGMCLCVCLSVCVCLCVCL